MNKIFFSIAVLATGLVSCSSDDGADTVVNQPLPLSVEVTENSWNDPDGANAKTRSTITSTSTLNSFSMIGKGHSYTATKTEGVWSTDPAYWPSNATADEAVTFYAYNGGTYNDGPYINFTVDGSVAFQKDFLVATCTTTQNTEGGKIRLTFDHACTAVQFSIVKTASLADYIITVKNVVLCNVLTNGKYYYATKEWSDMKTPANYELNTHDITVGTTPTLLASEGGDYMFMIPQTLKPWNKTAEHLNDDYSYVELDCVITGTGGKEGFSYSGKAYIPFGLSGQPTWNMGQGYHTTLAIGTGLRKADGNKVF